MGSVLVKFTFLSGGGCPTGPSEEGPGKSGLLTKNRTGSAAAFAPPALKAGG